MYKKCDKLILNDKIQDLFDKLHRISILDNYLLELQNNFL